MLNIPWYDKFTIHKLVCLHEQLKNPFDEIGTSSVSIPRAQLSDRVL